jgi:prophage tail gpP-like protein
VLTQPATWALRLGSSSLAADIIEKVPPNTPFKLFIAQALQMSGNTDAVGASGTATQITVRGRDALAPLHDSGIERLKTFIDGSYYDMVAWTLEQVGLDPTKLIKTNTNNRKMKAGIPIAELEQIEAESRNIIVNQAAASANGETVGKIIHQEHQNAIAESALSLIRRHIDRAGLMLWATADGHFCLSIPNASQRPAYRLIRRANGKSEGANVVDCDFMNDTTHRHALSACYSRTGGRKHGRAMVQAGVADDEMVNWGFRKAVLFRDVNVQNKQQGEFLCSRKLAEERRNGWRLSYTVAGHSLPAVDVSAGKRGIITVDTTVEVIDEVLGIEEVFYVESVRRQRHTSTTTTLRLMRQYDLLLGAIED